MVDERDWIMWMDFEVGDRDEPTFMRMLERLPDAERYGPTLTECMAARL